VHCAACSHVAHATLGSGHWSVVLQGVKVTINSRGGHSSMPPVNGDSIGARLGAFLSAMTESPPAPRLESPTKDLVEGLLQLPDASRNPLLASLFKVWHPGGDLCGCTWAARLVMLGPPAQYSAQCTTEK
jgi:hypothetical protein